jgi:uncharacterized RDD family membrane protein YckC
LNPLRYQYAGAGRRLGALLINLFLVAAFLGSVALVWITLSEKTPEWQSHLVGVWVGGTGLIAVLLKIVLDSELQGTPGLHLVDCRLVDARSGGAITLSQSVKRALGFLLAALPAGLGLAWMIWDKRRQGLHDKLAGTLVIREDDASKSLTELARSAL